MEFTDKIYELAQPIWLKSFHHPFIKQLISGSLPLSNFRFYLIQNYYYLNQIKKLYRFLSDKLKDKRAVSFFKKQAQSLENGGNQTYKNSFSQLNITLQHISLVPPAPTVYNYINHLYVCINRGSISQSLASLLPCYWLYNKLGKTWVKKGSPVSFYQKWLDSCASLNSTKDTQFMIRLVNQVANQANKKQKDKMIEAFLKSSVFELHFWQMAQTKESWDI